MNIKQLEYIIEISKCGSINKAAQNLYITQSSLSAAVKQLEQEVGYEIFRRKNFGIELTSEGKIFLLSAKMIHDEAERIRKIPQMFDSRKNLSVSCTWSSAMMCGFMEFLKKYPAKHVRDDFKETGFQQAVRDVMDQTYRLSVVSCVNSRSELHIRELDKYHISMEILSSQIPAAAVFLRNHRLSRLSEITIEQLKRYPIVSYDIHNSDDWIGQLGLSGCENMLNIFDRGSLTDAVRHGYVAVIPQDMELEKTIPVFESRNISDGPLSSIYLLHHKAYHLNEREKSFISWMKKKIS